MPNSTGKMTEAPRSGPCPHVATALCIDVAAAGYAKHLRLHTCGVCQRRWWEGNGIVIDLPEVLRIIGDVARRPRPSAQPRPPRKRLERRAAGIYLDQAFVLAHGRGPTSASDRARAQVEILSTGQIDHLPTTSDLSSPTGKARLPAEGAHG